MSYTPYNLSLTSNNGLIIYLQSLLVTNNNEKEKNTINELINKFKNPKYTIYNFLNQYKSNKDYCDVIDIHDYNYNHKNYDKYKQDLKQCIKKSIKDFIKKNNQSEGGKRKRKCKKTKQKPKKSRKFRKTKRYFKNKY